MITKFNGKTPKISATAFISESAQIIGDVEIGEHSSVWFGAVIRADRSKIKIGSKTNVQDNAIIHSEPESAVEIGNDVTIGHGAVLHGCKIRNNAIIGMNATVMDGSEIEENSIVGAGALVTPGKKFPPKSIILGVPGAVKKEASKEDVEKIKSASFIYVNLSEEYKKMQKNSKII